MAEDKGHKPTKRRLDKARRDGNVARSQILSQCCVVIAVLATVWAGVHAGWVSPAFLLNYCFSVAASEVLACSREYFGRGLFLILVAVGAGALAGAAVEILVVGVRVECSVLAVKPERLDPIAGFGRITSGLMQLWRSVLMFLVLGLVISGVLLWTLRSGLSSSGGLVGADPAVVLAWGGQSILFLFAAAVLLLLAFGVFEWLLNKRNLMRELSMSVDEVRREYREDEGDPILKYTRRAMHESLALQDLERRVRQARVIVVERNSLDGPDSS